MSISDIRSSDQPVIPAAPAVPQATGTGSTYIPVKASRPDPMRRNAEAFTRANAVTDHWLPGRDSFVIPCIAASHAATMRLPGAPVWLVLVAGSGAGKTERVIPLDGLPGSLMVDELSGPPAFLSRTPVVSDVTDKSHGGILRVIGDGPGVIIIRDMSSLLSLPRVTLGLTVAALREIYDGKYTRNLGGDGGITLQWEGKCGFIACVTGAIENHYKVISDLGTRWLYIRLPERRESTLDAAYAAIDNAGSEDKMRAEIKNAWHEVMLNPQEPYPITDSVREQLANLSELASLARSPVNRESGNILDVPEREEPYRIGKQLIQIWRACGILGIPEDFSREMLTRIGLDSVPRLRGRTLRVLYAAGSDRLSLADVTAASGQPVKANRSVRRALEDLEAHGLTESVSAGRTQPGYWGLTDMARVRLAGSGALTAMYIPPYHPAQGASESPARAGRDASPGARPRARQRAAQSQASPDPWAE